MKLTLDLNYQQTNGNGMSNIELSADYIQYAVTNTHPEMEGQMRRIFGRLQRKLDAAVEDKAAEIELEQAEQDLLRKSFRDCKVPAQISKYFMVLEEEVERLS